MPCQFHNFEDTVAVTHLEDIQIVVNLKVWCKFDGFEDILCSLPSVKNRFDCSRACHAEVFLVPKKGIFLKCNKIDKRCKYGSNLTNPFNIPRNILMFRHSIRLLYSLRIQRKGKSLPLLKTVNSKTGDKKCMSSFQFYKNPENGKTVI